MSHATHPSVPIAGRTASAVAEPPGGDQDGFACQFHGVALDLCPDAEALASHGRFYGFYGTAAKQLCAIAGQTADHCVPDIDCTIAHRKDLARLLDFCGNTLGFKLSDNVLRREPIENRQ